MRMKRESGWLAVAGKSASFPAHLPNEWEQSNWAQQSINQTNPASFNLMAAINLI